MNDRCFALDTNLLCRPTARRLLHGIALETSNTLIILPEVHEELVRRNAQLVRAEIDRWEQRSRRKGVHVPDQKQEEIKLAIRHAAIEWYESETQQVDSIFERLPDSDKDREQTIEIARSLPDRFFDDDWDGYNVQGDRLIVAQAIFFNIPLLGSNNLSTIDHEGLNNWLLSKGFNQPLLHTPSETIEALSKEQDGDESVYRWFMAHVMNRCHEHEYENRRAFLKTLDILNTSGFRFNDRKETGTFRTVVFRVRTRFRHDRNFQKTLKETLVEKQEVRKKALETELRLNQKVNMAIDRAMEAPLKDVQKKPSSHWFLGRD